MDSARAATQTEESENRTSRRRFMVGALASGGALVAVEAQVAAPSVALAGPAAQAQPSEAGTAARFSITIDGYEIAAFSELAGIVTEAQPVDYLEANDKEVVYKKLPGKTKPPTIILKRGRTTDMTLWAWYEMVRSGEMVSARKAVSLVMYNVDGKPVARYFLEHAWPAKVEIGALRAGSSEVSYETVHLVCERMQRVAV